MELVGFLVLGSVFNSVGQDRIQDWRYPDVRREWSVRQKEWGHSQMTPQTVHNEHKAVTRHHTLRHYINITEILKCEPAHNM